MVKLKRYFVAIMIAANQLVNALMGGDPYESISARLGDARIEGSKVATSLCWVLEKVDIHNPSRPDHCDEAIRVHQERLDEAQAKIVKDSP